ncbi:hypothetical protein DFH09DRAFT_1097024 [Mycena vulgaris]|nr:hypothetical protein DFH09DRAFT_1097024 [Mycena vulgaris]
MNNFLYAQKTSFKLTQERRSPMDVGALAADSRGPHRDGVDAFRSARHCKNGFGARGSAAEETRTGKGEDRKHRGRMEEPRAPQEATRARGILLPLSRLHDRAAKGMLSAQHSSCGNIEFCIARDATKRANQRSRSKSQGRATASATVDMGTAFEENGRDSASRGSESSGGTSKGGTSTDNDHGNLREGALGENGNTLQGTQSSARRRFRGASKAICRPRRRMWIERPRKKEVTGVEDILDDSMRTRWGSKNSLKRGTSGVSEMPSTARTRMKVLVLEEFGQIFGRNENEQEGRPMFPLQFRALESAYMKLRAPGQRKFSQDHRNIINRERLRASIEVPLEGGEHAGGSQTRQCGHRAVSPWPWNQHHCTVRTRRPRSTGEQGDSRAPPRRRSCCVYEARPHAAPLPSPRTPPLASSRVALLRVVTPLLPCTRPESRAHAHAGPGPWAPGCVRAPGDVADTGRGESGREHVRMRQALSSFGRERISALLEMASVPLRRGRTEEKHAPEGGEEGTHGCDAGLTMILARGICDPALQVGGLRTFSIQRGRTGEESTHGCSRRRYPLGRTSSGPAVGIDADLRRVRSESMLDACSRRAGFAPRTAREGTGRGGDIRIRGRGRGSWMIWGGRAGWLGGRMGDGWAKAVGGRTTRITTLGKRRAHLGFAHSRAAAAHADLKKAGGQWALRTRASSDAACGPMEWRMLDGETPVIRVDRCVGRGGWPRFPDRRWGVQVVAVRITAQASTAANTSC